MASEGVRTQQEIIPSMDMPEFEKALSTMDSLESKLNPLYDRARRLEVTDRATREEAKQILDEAKSYDKLGEATIAPYKSIVNRVKDYLLTRERKVANRKEEIRMALTPKMNQYDRAEEAATLAEQKRVQDALEASLKRQAEERRLADELAAKELRTKRVAEIRSDLKAGRINKRQSEKLLREAGAFQEAALAQAAAEADEATQRATETAKNVTVESNVPSGGRRNYHAACIDEDLFLLAFCAEYVALGRFGELRKFVKVNNQALGEEARDMKNTKKMLEKYAGISASDDKSF